MNTRPVDHPPGKPTSKAADAKRLSTPEGTDIEQLVEDLKTHQVELEMQNHELRIVQQALDEEKERYADLFEFAPIGYVILNRDSLIQELNWTAADMLGIKKNHVYNNPFTHNIESISRDDFYAFWQKLRQGEQALSCELAMKRKDGTRFYARIEAKAGEQQQGIRLALVDVSDRFRAEQALLEANENLERANDNLEKKVQERTAELGKSVRELRSVKEEIDSHAQRLRGLTQQLILTEQRERRRIAQVLHDGLQQQLAAAQLALGGFAEKQHNQDRGVLLDQVEQMLRDSITTARILTTELSPPALYHGGLTGGLEWLASWMKQKHGLTVDLSLEKIESNMSDDLKFVLFDAVREMLFNVLKHAEVRLARVQLEAAGDAIQITVMDNGRGFDPQAEKPAGQEGGFGLFSIQERLQTLGGKLEVESRIGKGSRFRIHVAKVISTSPSSRSAIRLMLVDDHSAVRESLARLLESENGIEVVAQASDGEGAIHLAAKVKPSAILMDIEMPGLDGIEATRRIRSEHPETRIIAFSMHAEGPLVEGMLRAGAATYITKDCSLSQLVETIRKYA